MLLKVSTEHWEINWPEADAEIAIIDGKSLRLQYWLKEVAAATNWLREKEGAALLYQPDWYRFSVWFFALLSCQKRVILPANDKPATLAELSSQYSFRVPDELPPPSGADSLLPVLRGALNSSLTFFTSGSSGAPKAVEKNIKQLLLEVLTLEQTFSEPTKHTSILSTVTHQHIYGLLFTVLWPISAARSVTLPLVDYPEQLQQRLATADPERYVLVSTPAHLQRLDNLPQLAHYRQSLLRVFSSGGPLPASVPKAFADNQLTVPTEVYGSTETGGIAWRQRNPGNSSDFTPLADVTVSCDDDDLLVVQSPYLNAPAGRYTTEDKICLQAEGRFQLLGRRDNIVKIAEKRVSLNEIEAFTQRHDWVASVKACVLRSPRVELGLVLVLTPKGHRALTAQGRFTVRQELRHHLQQRFEKVVVPKRFRYVPQLPYNASGKLTQADLNTLFEEGK